MSLELTTLAPRYAALIHTGAVVDSRMLRCLTLDERTALAGRFIRVLETAVGDLGLALTESEPVRVYRPGGQARNDAGELRDAVAAAEEDLLAATNRLADFLGLVERRRQYWHDVVAREGAPA